jgi:membrane protease YdiL (CAAX protease family)
MPRQDPVRVAIHFAVYVALFFISSMIFGWVLAGVAYPAGIIATSVLAAGFANWLAMRIYEERHLVDAGLWWNRASSANLAFGLAGGAGSAAAVLLPPLVFRGARLLSSSVDRPTVGSIIYLLVLLAAGVLGEELLFRGYGFQLLLRCAGPYATILTVLAFGLVFAFLHGSNPNATWFGLANTAAFGILFGYAYLRSRDLWLPIGLHLGWNFTLPLFGVNLSGLRMRMTGYEMSWSAGALWSGGEYGPEASLLTSAVVVALFFYLWKAPIRRQCSPLSDPPLENAPCAQPPRLPS